MDIVHSVCVYVYTHIYVSVLLHQNVGAIKTRTWFNSLLSSQCHEQRLARDRRSPSLQLPFRFTHREARPRSSSSPPRLFPGGAVGSNSGSSLSTWVLLGR